MPDDLLTRDLISPALAARVPVAQIRFVKELYPRLREDDAAIERYRASIDRLPPIVIARDGILVDGYHRWQAHKRENLAEIEAQDLGNISDAEILTHSYRLNATHGKQLSKQEKINAACQLYFTLPGTDRERYEIIADVLSLNLAVAQKYAADAKRETERQKRERAWDLWLDCWTQQAIADEIGIDQGTISRWICDLELRSDLHKPPGATDAEPWGRVQHFDIWQFARADGDSSHFGRMPPQVVENLLWGFTSPGDIVVDPFAGGGTTIDVAKAMGRRVWASDLLPRSELLPIHRHNMLDGWPADAPSRANLILLDPPYWQQAKGEYSAKAIYALLKGDQLIRSVTRAGIERGDLADVIDDIRRSNNPMERRLRFNPDGAVLVHRLAHWEAKASLFIEKQPYEFYMEYENRGEPVILFIAPGLLKHIEFNVSATLWCGRVKDLVLRHGTPWEAQFPVPRPIDPEGWVQPRADNNGLRRAKHGPTGSGTPFRPIDIRQSRMVRISQVRLIKSDKCEIEPDFFPGDTIGRLT